MGKCVQMVFHPVCTKRGDVKKMTRKVVCELGTGVRHRPVDKRTAKIFWLSAKVVLFMTKQKSILLL